MVSRQQAQRAADRAARKYKIDPRIFRGLITAESNWNPNAGSPAGARGIAQFMPATARSMGVNLDDGRISDDLDGAARYLRNNLRMFDGSYRKALAAYNAGPGAVQKHGGVPPYAETQAYVRKVLGYAGTGGAPTAPAASPSSAPNSQTADPATQMQERTTFDQTGFDTARRQALLGQILARRNPNNRLLQFGALSTEAPSRQAFERTEQIEVAGPRTNASNQRGGRLLPTASTASTGRFSGRPFGDYQGSKGPADQLAKIGKDLGLKVTSTKRHNANPYSGRNSDHDHGNKNAYAYDLSNGSNPTPEMDRAAFRMARRLGIKDYKMGTPINRTVTKGGVRVQIIYRGTGPAFGGNHMNHVHIGARRVK